MLQPKQSLDSQDGRQRCAVWNKGLFAKGPRNTTTGQRRSTYLVQKRENAKLGAGHTALLGAGHTALRRSYFEGWVGSFKNMFSLCSPG